MSDNSKILKLMIFGDATATDKNDALIDRLDDPSMLSREALQPFIESGKMTTEEFLDQAIDKP